ncbi:ABC transporter ATP-binding protein [Rubellimicrobium sp. CFH 75288]|uniref:ABC transporter ATP-binding protein n=1 Tax=Rubellimicrobium sp. CFH 75288 TaxID=2697034 RepID=UPI001411D13B|nr:ABC transporter ATP-binding protein [Rubellimicrobium sp. CFH 75288]NAZ37116.1 ATP-binding cassette domain-containing protein [Rubellimicrobium sp. CFH 75288]
MSHLDLQGLQKSFGANRVVRDFSLSIDKGEFVSLLGPSGCGKTTVLRMVAGFETPDTGAIRLEGRDLIPLRTNARNVGMVFQAYALFPNLTVAQNVGFGLKVAGVPRQETAERVAEMLDLIGLPVGDFGSRYPFQLSGGQQQRVALARALAPRPRVLLLDEPLSALDAKVRVRLRSEIRTIQRHLGITTIFVTHDQEEALSISDRVVVMNAGILEQAGTPFEVYNHPATAFVASFVGTLTPFEARVLESETGLVDVSGRRLRLGRRLPRAAGEALTLALRPEALRLGRPEDEAIQLSGVAREVEFMGSIIRIRAEVGGTPFVLDTFNRPDAPPPAPGEAVDISFSPRDVIVVGA